MRDKIVFIGAGGYFRGVIDSFFTSYRDKYNVVGITDPSVDKGTLIENIPVLGDDSILQQLYDSGVRYAHITVGSVGDCTLRKKLIKRAKDIGFELISIVDSSAIIAKGVKLGEMVYVGKGAIINNNVNIGDFCIMNTGCIIEHGCRIGDFVHIAPGAVLVGDISVGNNSHIGLNASLLQGIKVGKNVIVGAGSTVLRNIEDGETVVGVVK